MSLPRPLKAQEVLDLVKDKLSKQEENIEILEQAQYKSKVSALPSLKTESFILFKKLDNNSLHIARTENLEIKQILSVEEFTNIVNVLPSFEQKKIINITSKISENINKPQM